MRSLVALTRFNRRFDVQSDRSSFNPVDDNSRSAFSRFLNVALTLAIFAVSTPAYPGKTPYPATAPQGSSDRKTVIEVRTPPKVYLPGPTFRTQVTSQKPVTPRVIELLQRSIEQTLLRNDPRLRLDQASGSTSIICTIIDFTASPGVETRTRPEYQKIGETIVIDPTTGMSRTEDVYGNVDVPFRALVLEGRMNVKCEVTDVATGILLYSDRFAALLTDAREVGTGAGAISVDDLNFVYLKLADNAANLILAQLSPRVFSEVVTLPSGKLKEASKLLEAGLWAEALAFLSAVAPFKDPNDDAYRYYSIGVAHEALAYQTLDPFEKKLHLGRAVDNYRRSAELKPNEDIFWAPKYRAEAVLLQINGLVAQVEAFEQAKRPGSNPANNADRVAAGNADLFHQTRARIQTGAPVVINNQTVIEWVKSGRSADYIAASIKHAPETQFNLSPAEVLKLRREGVNNSVLKAMTRSQQGHRSGIGSRTATLIILASLLWWLPLLFGR